MDSVTRGNAPARRARVTTELDQADQAVTDAVLNALNGYQGHDIWQDVIYNLLTAEEWDAAPVMNRFERRGVTYRYEPSMGKWVANA